MTSVSIDSLIDGMAIEQLKTGHSIRFIARGQSMWPFILDGDSVTVAPLNRLPHVGDVVFMPNREFGQLHRVVSTSDDGLLCLRGDALPKSDGWFPPARLLGILVEHRRRGWRIPVMTGKSVVRIASTLAKSRRRIHRMRSFFGFH